MIIQNIRQRSLYSLGLLVAATYLVWLYWLMFSLPATATITSYTTLFIVGYAALAGLAALGMSRHRSVSRGFLVGSLVGLCLLGIAFAVNHLLASGPFR